VQKLSSQTCAALGGDYSSYLHRMGFIGLDEQPKAGGTFPLVVQREKVSAYRVYAVDIRVGAVLLYHEYIAPCFQYRMELIRSQLCKFFAYYITHIFTLKSGAPAYQERHILSFVFYPYLVA
jgi:hypothetical protein